MTHEIEICKQEVQAAQNLNPKTAKMVMACALPVLQISVIFKIQGHCF
jgi:hypothetical protein